MSQQKKAQAQAAGTAPEVAEAAKEEVEAEEDPEIPTRDRPRDKDIESQNSKSAKKPSEQASEEQNEARNSAPIDAVSSHGTGRDITQDYQFEVIELESHEPLQTTYEDGEQINVVQLFYPDKCPLGRRQGNVFHCNQQLYRRPHSDGRVTLIWTLHNIGSDDFLNKLGQQPHYVESGVFETIEGITWQLRLEPGCWPVKSQSQGSQGNPQQQISTKSTRSKIELVAIPTEAEIAGKRINRRIEVKFSTFHLNGELHTQKDWYREYEYKDEGEVAPAPIIYDQFCVFPQPRTMKANLLSEQYCVQIEILNKLPKDRAPVRPQPDASSASGSTGEKPKEEKAQNMYVNQFKGLMNEGTTCYLNSVIQALFFIRPFRNAVYKMPTITIEVDPKKLESSIPFCLQRIFYNLQLGNASFVRTHELLQAFGWNSQDINQQQDVNEFNCILSDQLDKQMQNTPVQGTFNRLFEGEAQNVIKCINVEYESTRDDKFNTIQLRVRGNNTIEDSVRQYIKEERLDGQNQYQTDDFGKQDALKFIRFKKLPPVLQISLQRYEYDLNVQQIVKENLKFEFKDVLDLESILPNAPKEKSEITNTEVVNRYHLHSILVHRGTANAGHYYAFIKPTLEDHWYEFNDSKVSEVGRDYAFGQGIGGNLSSFEFLRQTMYKESTGQLIERLKENFANAYMLIYVRETEREAIMCDKLTIDEQVPMELQMHFRTEELFKDQIQQDFEYFEQGQGFGKLQLMSAETLQHADWDGPFLCQKFKDERQPWKFKFESDQKQHMALYVSKSISVNEFIIMLKNRLFPHDDNVELEDIWLYRVQISKNPKSSCHFQYTLHRNVYSIEDKYECPLFSARQSWDTQDWQQEQKQSTKWKRNMLQNNITRLIVINPQKLDPRTGEPYSVLHKMGEQETEAYKEHYNLFIEYIKKTDMMQGAYYLNMYNTFNDCQYSFSEFNDLKVGEDQGNPDSKVAEGGSAAAPAHKINPEESRDENQIESARPPSGSQTGPGSIFGPIDEIRRSIQRYRDKFVFEYDRSLADQQRKDYEEFISKQDNQMDPVKEDAERELSRNQSRLYLVFVKVADLDDCRLNMKGMLFFHLDQPIDLKEIQKKAGLTDDELQNFDLFIEPYSTQMVRHHADIDKRAGQFKQEQYLERGLTQFKKSAFDIFRVEPDKIKDVPLKEFVKPTVEGLCFTYFPNRVRSQNERGEEWLTLAAEVQAHQYYLLVGSLVNRGYVKVCYLSDQDITKNAMSEMVLGYHQFNYQDGFDAILRRVARICRQFGLDVLVGSQQNLLNHIQLFDDEIKVVSFQDYGHNPLYADQQTLENLVTEQFYLNFTVHQIPFSKIDHYAEARFIQFLADEVIPTGKQPYQSLRIIRECAVKDFLHQWQAGGKNSGVYLTMELDRETGTITKIFKDQTSMALIVGSRKCLSLHNVPTILRVNEVKSDDVARINEIIHESGSQNCCFAFVWIYDQYKKKREQYKQFAVPFNKQSDTFGDIIEQTKLKLEQLKRKATNNLELADLESLRMWTIKYNNKFYIQKQRVCYLDDFDWRNPMLQYEVNQLSQVAALTLCHEYPNTTNEMYQPYSVNANKNGQGWFHFVYLAAQLNFSEPPDSSPKPKEAKRSATVGGFSINNQN